MTIFELCVEDLEAVRAAGENGADRVEICEDLSLGGLSPHLELVEAAAGLAPSGGMVLMVRPRGGDFVYNQREIDQMCRQAEAFSDFVHQMGREIPVPVELITGALKANGELDEKALAKVREAGGGLNLACHRAFDLTPSLSESLEALESLGYIRVLTTGGHRAQVQVGVLRALVASASPVSILASGGLRAHNVAQVISESGVREIHLRAPFPDARPGTDPQLVREIADILKQ